MKIMYLIDTYQDPYAGTERQLYNLVKGLDSSLFQPAMTLFRSSTWIEKHGFPCLVESLDIGSLSSPTSLIKLIAFAFNTRRRGYRLVHIFFNDASLIAPVILKAAGIRVIVSRRDMGFWYTPARLLILRLNRFFVDRVIANCEAVKRITLQKEHFKPHCVQVIYNGYLHENTHLGKHIPGTIPELRSHDNQIIGIVANIRPVKRIGDLLLALHIVRKRHPDAELVIVGSGDAAPLKKLAEELGLSAHVHFTGPQTIITPLISQFNVAVLCSASEGLSNAIIEYMYCRIPVVCTATGGNDELVSDNETGYLVPVGDVEALADRIHRVFIEPEHAAEMARNAFNHINKLCDMNIMLSRHAALYKQLTHSAPAAVE